MQGELQGHVREAAGARAVRRVGETIPRDRAGGRTADPRVANRRGTQVHHLKVYSDRKMMVKHGIALMDLIIMIISKR